MEVFRASDANRCPYCSSNLRRVPALWLGHGGFECDRCGDFLDFSRELTDADGTGTVDDADDEPIEASQSL